MFAASMQAVIENMCARGMKGGGGDPAGHAPWEWRGRSTFQASSFSKSFHLQAGPTPHINLRMNAVRLHVNPKFNAH